MARDGMPLPVVHPGPQPPGPSPPQPTASPSAAIRSQPRDFPLQIYIFPDFVSSHFSHFHQSHKKTPLVLTMCVAVLHIFWGQDCSSEGSFAGSLLKNNCS